MGVLGNNRWWQVHRWRRLLCCRLLLLLTILQLGLALTVHGEPLSDEYSLKAAFIYNFAKFIDWPASASSREGEFYIAILGRSPLGRELAKLHGRSVRGRKIIFREVDSAAEAQHYQILFVSRSELGSLTAILEDLRQHPVLIVSDHDDFCRRGGMLSLVNEGGKIVFDVNIREAQNAGLKPNPQLLRLARRIYGRQ